MPVTSPTGQPGLPSDWFASTAGRALLDSQDKVVDDALAERPAPGWLWLAPVLSERPVAGQGVRLAADGRGWAGPVRCALPLPLAGESIATVVLQHPPVSPARAALLLAECARVLVPGGRLHLLALNPLSPYRWHWRGTALQASEPLSWRRRLRQAGLLPEPVSQGVGPVWQPLVQGALRNGPGLRAAYLLRADKRLAAPVGRIRAQTPVRIARGAPA